MNSVGIVGLGLYIPETKMTAKEISEATNGIWSEEAVIKKIRNSRKNYTRRR